MSAYATILTGSLKIVYSIKCVGKIGQILGEKMKVEHVLTPCRRIISKWIKDLNVRLKTINILENNVGSKMSDISHSNIFF